MLAARTRQFATRSRLFHTSTSLWRQSVYSYDDIKSATTSPTKRIIDVREPDEYSAGSIPSSFNIPLSSFEQSLKLPDDDFKRKFNFDKPAKDDEVVFYCRAGVRSTSASDIAEKLGYGKIGNYKGSWNEWSAKTPTDKSSDDTVSLKEVNEKEQARADAEQPDGNKTGHSPLAQTAKEGESESVKNGAELAGDGDQKKFS